MLPTVWLAVLLAAIAPAASAPITIGGLFPVATRAVGIQRLHGAQLAVDVVNADASILPHNTLELVNADTFQNPGLAARNTLAMCNNGSSSIVALVGASSSSVSVAAAYTAASFHVPQVSYSSTSTALSSEVEFPFFARVVPGDSAQGAAIAALVQYYGWRTMAIISEDSSYGSSLSSSIVSSVGSSLTIATSRQHPQVVSAADLSAHFAEVDGILADIKELGVRIISLNSLAVDAQIVLWRAALAGMLGAPPSPESLPFVWVGSDGWVEASIFQPSAYCDAECIALITPALAGSLGVRPSATPLLQPWIDDVWNPTAGADNLTDCMKTLSGADSWVDAPNFFASYAFDAVLAVAYAMDTVCRNAGPAPADLVRGPTVCQDLLNSDGFTTSVDLPAVPTQGQLCAAAVRNGTALLSALLATTFESATGYVSFNANGDRPGTFDAINFQTSSVEGSPPSLTAMATVVGDTVNVGGGVTVEWPGMGDTVPADRAAPECQLGAELHPAFDGEFLCVRCESGTFGRISEDTGLSVCLDCPDGAFCPGGSTLTINAGYWFSPSSLAIGDFTSIPALLECRSGHSDVHCCPDGGCLLVSEEGLVILPDDTLFPESAFNHKLGASLNSSQLGLPPPVCRTLHHGPVCGSCQDEATLFGTSCVECKEAHIPTIVWSNLVVIVWVFLYVLSGADEEAPTSILVDFLQLFAIVVSLRDNSSPQSVIPVDFDLFKIRLDSLSFTNACLMPLSALTSSAIGYFMPAALLFYTGVVFAVLEFMRWLHRKQGEAIERDLADPAKHDAAFQRKIDRAMARVVSHTVLRGARAKFYREVYDSGPKLRERFVVGFFRTLFLSYIVLTETSLGYFNCREVESAQLMETFPAVECNTRAWYLVAFLVAAPVLLVITIGLPVCMVIRLVVSSTNWGVWAIASVAAKLRVKAKAARTRSAIVSPVGATPPRIQQLLGSPAKPATPKEGPNSGFILRGLSTIATAMMLDMVMFRASVRSWYTAWYLGRRALLSVILVTMAQVPVARQGVLFLITILILFVQFQTKPYTRRVDNMFALLSLILVVCVAGLELYRVEVVTAAARNGAVADGWMLDASVGLEVVAVGLALLVWAVMTLAEWMKVLHRFHRHIATRDVRNAMKVLSPLPQRWREARLAKRAASRGRRLTNPNGQDAKPSEPAGQASTALAGAISSMRPGLHRGRLPVVLSPLQHQDVPGAAAYTVTDNDAPPAPV